MSSALAIDSRVSAEASSWTTERHAITLDGEKKMFESALVRVNSRKSLNAKRVRREEEDSAGSPARIAVDFPENGHGMKNLRATIKGSFLAYSVGTRLNRSSVGRFRLTKSKKKVSDGTEHDRDGAAYGGEAISSQQGHDRHQNWSCDYIEHSRGFAWNYEGTRQVGPAAT